MSFDVDHDNNLYDPVEKLLESKDGANADLKMIANEDKDRGNIFMDQPSNIKDEEGDDRYYTVQKVLESNDGTYVNQTIITCQDEDKGNILKETLENRHSNIKEEEVEDRTYTVHESKDGAYVNQAMIAIQDKDGENLLRKQPENIYFNVDKNMGITDVYDIQLVANKCQNNGEVGRSSPEKTKSGITTYIVNNELYGKFIYNMDKILGRLPPAIPDNASGVEFTDASKMGTPDNISEVLSQGSGSHISNESLYSAFNEECAPVNPGDYYSDHTVSDETRNANDAIKGCSNPIADLNITIVESLPVARTYRTNTRLLKVVTAVRAIETSSLEWLGSLMIIGAFLLFAFEVLILGFSCGLQMYIGMWVSVFLLVSGSLQLRLSRNTKTIGSTYIIVAIIALCLSLTALVVGFCLSLVLRVSLTIQICGEIAVLIVYAVSLNLVPVLYSVFYMFTHTFPKSK